MFEFMDDPIDRALTEISSLATNMNEGKRESESRRRLVQWQSRIRGKFPSPLVQPHRYVSGQLLADRLVTFALDGSFWMDISTSPVLCARRRRPAT